MKCLRCNRTLTNPTADNLGAVCRRKQAADTSGENKKVRIEILHKSPTRRSYLVFTSPRRRVVVSHSINDVKVAECDCRPAGICEHIEAIKATDDRLFPVAAPRVISNSKSEIYQNV